MSITANALPPAHTVDEWRAVLHDLVDAVLDRLLLTAEAEWEQEIDDLDDGWWWEDEEPPDDPPPVAADVPGLVDALWAGLAAAIGDGTRFWGCDGTLRCTRRWAEQVVDRPDVLLDGHRRAGRFCDCDVLRAAHGPDGPRLRCGRRGGVSGTGGRDDVTGDGARPVG